MAGWPGSYFQVIYPMGASAGTGTAPETPPPVMGGAPGVAAMPAGATGAVPITPAPVVMVSGPPVGSVPAAAAGSGDGTVPGPTVGSAGGTIPGPTVGTVPAAAVGSTGGTVPSPTVGTVPAAAVGSAGGTAPGPIVMIVPAAAAGSGGGTVPVSVPVTGQAVSAQRGPPLPVNTPAGPVVEKSPPVKLMPRPVEVPEPKAETRVMAKPMPKYVQLDPPAKAKQVQEPPAKAARVPGPKQPQGPPPGTAPRGSVALGSGKSSPCSFTQNLLLGDQGQQQMSQQLGMQLIHTMVRLTNAIDTLSGEMRRTREHSQPSTPLAALPPPPITTAAQRRRYEEQLEGQQRKERRTYERADQQDQYDDDNDTWDRGESSGRRSDRDGQDDSWGEWYYRKDWKR